MYPIYEGRRAFSFLRFQQERGTIFSQVIGYLGQRQRHACCKYKVSMLIQNGCYQYWIIVEVYKKIFICRVHYGGILVETNKISFFLQKLVEFVCRIFIKLINNFWDGLVTLIMLIMQSLFLTKMRINVGKCNIKEWRLYWFLSVLLECFWRYDNDDELFLSYGWPLKGIYSSFQPALLSEILTIAILWHATRRVWTCAQPAFKLD